MQGPKLLHIHTTKGKGFGPAEKAATIWHAPGIFDKETGEQYRCRYQRNAPFVSGCFWKYPIGTGPNK